VTLLPLLVHIFIFFLFVPLTSASLSSYCFFFFSPAQGSPRAQARSGGAAAGGAGTSRFAAAPPSAPGTSHSTYSTSGSPSKDLLKQRLKEARAGKHGGQSGKGGGWLLLRQLDDWFDRSTLYACGGVLAVATGVLTVAAIRSALR
jgi:hypothetical protein